ncbi:MAG: DUF1648 domain-containing protein [Terriglobales bacterium]
MNRKYFGLLSALLWVALPVIALRYWMVWDRLPQHMASHFDAAGNANGWMYREQSLMFTLGFVAFMLAVFSLTLFIIHRKYPVGQLSWALLAFFHLEIWTIIIMLNSTLNYNLNGAPIITTPLLVVTPIGVLALIAIGFSEKRGTALAATDIIAEEEHAGKIWGAVLAIPLIGGFWAVAALPDSSLRLAAAIFCVVFIGACAMAWTGFQYYFTRHGLEIRTMGFRLKSVPAGEIKQYAAAPWSPLCGYGVRGLGNHKAYVWGNRGVKVTMNDGELFLGHNDPQRIIHDLDAMKQVAN